jgi:hypothetical protein
MALNCVDAELTHARARRPERPRAAPQNAMEDVKVSEWLKDDDACPGTQRWPMAPTDLLPARAVAAVGAAVERRDRPYRLPARSACWEKQVRVEALAALAA